jgi:hypothetical protein
MRTLSTFALQIKRGEDHEPSRVSVVLSTAAPDADGVLRLTPRCMTLDELEGADQRAPGRAGRAESGCAASVHGQRGACLSPEPHRRPIRGRRCRVADHRPPAASHLGASGRYSYALGDHLRRNFRNELCPGAAISERHRPTCADVSATALTTRRAWRRTRPPTSLNIQSAPTGHAVERKPRQRSSVQRSRHNQTRTEAGRPRGRSLTGTSSAGRHDRFASTARQRSRSATALLLQQAACLGKAPGRTGLGTSRLGTESQIIGGLARDRCSCLG